MKDHVVPGLGHKRAECAGPLSQPPSGIAASQTAFHTDAELLAARAALTAAKLKQLADHTNDTADFQTLNAFLEVTSAGDNRERHEQESRVFNRSAKHVYVNALLYQLTGESAHAVKAIDLILRWVKTVRGISRWANAPLVAAYTLSGMVKGYGLVKGLMTPADQARVNKWLIDVVLPRANSVLYKSWQSSYVASPPAPTNSLSTRNNWTCWGTFTSALIYDVTGAAAGLQHMRAQAEYLIREIIDPTHFNIGPETHRQDRGLWYTYFALAPLTAAMKVLRDSALGTDLFEQGGKVERALDKLFGWYADPASYPYWSTSQNPPLDTGAGKRWPENLIAAARNFYPARGWPAQTDAFYVDHHYAWTAPLIVPPRGAG